MELLHARFVGRDGRAFDADAAGLDRLGGVDGDLVVGGVAMFEAEVEILQLDVEIGVDELFADQPPDDSRHFVAVELDDGMAHFDLGHRRVS